MTGSLGKIKGYACYSKDEPIKPFEYEPRPLGDKDVEIKISACGICHSDIHTYKGDWGPAAYPLIVGHEIVGTVVSKGSLVKNLNVGDRVGVGAACWSCLEPQCHECSSKADQLCARRVLTYGSLYPDGQKSQGGYAEYVRVQSEWAFPIPTQFKDEEAAPLLCAGATVFTPLKRHGVTKGVDCGIVGIGGLGHLAIQFAAKLGASVTAISTSASKENESKQLGATKFLNSKDEEQVKKATSTLDVILCTASAGAEAIATYLQILRPNGRLIIVGAPEKGMHFHPMMLIGSQKSIIGSLIGSTSDIQEMLKFSAEHNVKPWISVLPMAEVNKGIQMVEENKARYRVVLKN